MPLSFSVETVPLSYDADGVIHVGNTRITLDTFIGAFQDGSPAEEIVQQYPSLKLPDVYQVIGYYLRQTVEVDEYLNHRKSQSDTVREQNESHFDPYGLRDRLLARRTSSSE